MLQHHKGKVYTVLKKQKQNKKQKNTHTINSVCVLDAELDCFEDSIWKKRFWANKDEPF